MSRLLTLITALVLSLFLLPTSLIAQGEQQKETRTKAAKLQKDGNYKEALALYRELLTETDDDKSSSDLEDAINCLAKLNLISKADSLLEKQITRHSTNPSFLITAGKIHTSVLPHHGHIIAGEFKRGNNRGGGQYANASQRDRIRSLQLHTQALRLQSATQENIVLAYHGLNQALRMNRQGNRAWKLQTLTDISTLPDYEIGNRWGRGGRDPKGAPVDTDGSPLFYKLPASWDQAKNDGERWRYAMQQALPKQQDEIDEQWAQFLHSQFAVTTMANYGWFRNISSTTGDEQKGILQLHTLKDNETVAKLASGVKRFTLPDDQNFITLYQNLKTRRESAADRLIQIYLDRRQHEKSVKLLTSTIEQFPNSSSNKSRKKLLQQISGDWGRFENLSGAFPAGDEPSIDYVFRNATSVTLTVRPVDTEKMVNDLWNHLDDNPAKLEWELLRWNNLAEQLVNGSRKNYVGEEIARRTHTLKPRKHHWDARTSLSVPVKKTGAYLVSALLENGVTTHTVVWLDATVIVQKELKQGSLYYLTDAITGQPIPSANLEFFGYQQQRLKKPGKDRRYNILIKRLTKTTAKDGTLLLKPSELDRKYQWMIKAKSKQGTALLGFSNPGYHHSNHSSYTSHKAFGITDRPVYQPGQKVYGKFWAREARYDLGEISSYAGKKFKLTITDALGAEIVKDLSLTADNYGGIEYNYDLPEDAKLGAYNVRLRHDSRHIGNHSFRVEEYKKPEYEVIVDAPTEPVMLGESFKATVKASYYHGAPVTEAKVVIKVMRSRHNDLWFPIGRWDWLYGGGYGWLDIERPWYPGWKSWGCFCPRPFWWNRGGEQPEIVLEQELEIGPDGTVKVDIDTSLAKAVHSDTDHRYSITAEVVDASRRTIVGQGSVIAARQAYQVSVWLNKGYARVGEPIQATVASRSADGKSVDTQGEFILYQITSKDGKVSETEIKRWKTETKGERNGELKFQAGKAGQYRLAALMTDAKDRKIEGAILFTVRGDGQAEGNFQYSDLELIPDKRTYAKGDTVKLLINTKRPNSTVLLSLRGGLTHQFVKLKGQSTTVEIPVDLKDMPNFFIEAATVSNAVVHTAVREIIVPPEKRILNVEVLPNKSRVKPRAEGKVKVRITDQHGEPVQGSLALTIYDKSLEYISGGSNVVDIKKHFWKWRRHFRGGFTHSLSHNERNVLKKNDERMRTLGAFGHSIADQVYLTRASFGNGAGGFRSRPISRMAKGAAVPMAAWESADAFVAQSDLDSATATAAPVVMIRKDFADLVKWIGSVETDTDGVAVVPVTFPDNLTTWKIKTWAMAHGTRVGEGSAEVITSKDLIIRLQAPRFFIEKDEVVLSAVVHNYLKTDQEASISLELEGGTLTSSSPLTQKQSIKAGAEKRIDWRCKVTQEGEAIVRMKVITQDDSDAMEMSYPVYVHGILKQQAWSRVIPQDQNSTSITVNVPAERRPDQTRLEIRYSPTIAGSIVAALPYLAEYPYGCTEQTLNRFVPTVITQKLLREMDINLEEVRNQRANLNPQEIGDDKQRLAQWKRWQRNPVFSEKEVAKMARKGVERLAEMQLSDGGWGWFSGYGERSYPHTTAVVVHGLLAAKANGSSIPDGLLNDGINWLKNYETKETERIRMWKKRKKNTKQHADARDALIRLVLAEAKQSNDEMLEFLFRDKNQLSVYAKSLAGMACHLVKETEKRDAIIRNIMQYLVYDAENQSAHLKLGNEGYWWNWHGSEIEAHAWFLKLLAATQPKSKETRGLVKYLINNRKHATYWNSTRDTAYCIEAIADYMRASGEDSPNTEVSVIVDGKKIKTVKVTKDNLFAYDNKVVIAGDALGSGPHKIEIQRSGNGPLYTNTYLTVFTKEDFIKKAGLEVKVDRSYYKLERIDATEDTAGTQGQVIKHKVEKYKRIPLKSGDMLVSGDLVEVELHIHSKNDYEYLMFNDWKPAGLEAVDVRSGYTNNGMGAYMEMHHEKTSFFVRRLTRGEHSLKYRLRAEIPGSFSALPTQAEAMYAPEFKANSDEMKIQVKDQ